MYMKYVRLLFLICASAMYVGCSEDPFDWSGDSERSVPIPVDLSLEVVEDIVSASCRIEHHEDDLPILEVGFFYGDNEGVTYNTGTKIKCTVSGNVFTTEGISNFLSDNMRYCYVGAYITTSRGTVTIGPEYIDNSDYVPMPKPEGLSLSYSKPYVKARCNIDYSGTEYSIKKVGFYYGTYSSAVSFIECEVVNGSFQASIPVTGWSFCYVYAAVQSSKGTKYSETKEIHF